MQNEPSTNEKLRALLSASGLSQPRFLAALNVGQARPLSLSSLERYLANVDSVRFRSCPDAVLNHAKRAFSTKLNINKETC